MLFTVIIVLVFLGKLRSHLEKENMSFIKICLKKKFDPQSILSVITLFYVKTLSWTKY